MSLRNISSLFKLKLNITTPLKHQFFQNKSVILKTEWREGNSNLHAICLPIKLCFCLQNNKSSKTKTTNILSTKFHITIFYLRVCRTTVVRSQSRLSLAAGHHPVSCFHNTHNIHNCYAPFCFISIVLTKCTNSSLASGKYLIPSLSVFVKRIFSYNPSDLGSLIRNKEVNNRRRVCPTRTH